jgi:HD-GYP domain-containing protein (c-di-GMP phosphodiesterase class II)
VFDRLTLREDLVDCRGAVLAPRGLVVSPQSIDEAAERALRIPARKLTDTPISADLEAPFQAPVYKPLFDRRGAREAVEQTLRAVELPDPLVDELLAIRRDQDAAYRHALFTAAVGVRVLLTAVGQGRTLTELATAGLLHDIGMRHVQVPALSTRERLSGEQARHIAAHPLLGAYHVASVLGRHTAVAAARSHHWRCGQGYPALSAPPSRSVEVIAVSSAFCALTQPRSYRSAAYDARGAVDVLVRDTVTGQADTNTVKLLVHALRGGGGDLRGVRFGASRDGHGPAENGHSPVEAPARGML